MKGRDEKDEGRRGRTVHFRYMWDVHQANTPYELCARRASLPWDSHLRATSMSLHAINSGSHLTDFGFGADVKDVKARFQTCA